MGDLTCLWILHHDGVLPPWVTFYVLGVVAALVVGFVIAQLIERRRARRRRPVPRSEWP